ncbi:MAG: CBS domain-containing protein [Thaumarchaeota archaeon]|nr:CBS domain-containing protein [Nitrososphaerota archaeon]MDE1839203.1 CBS domain-containing protein [Nitrososphaerota archaeon]
MTKSVTYTTPVITLSSENNIYETLSLMKKNDIKRIVVINDANIPIGIVTERDIGKFLENDRTTRTLDKISLSEIMSRHIITIMNDQEELLVQCAIRMDAFQISSIVVVDEDGKLIGIVTKSDLVKNFSALFRGIYKVKNYMNTKMITCRKSDSLPFALNALNKNKISRLVVTDNDGKPVGVISYDTFLKNSEYFKFGTRTETTLEYLPLRTSAKELQVGDLIGDELLTIESEEDLAKAAKLMVQYKISGVPVVDHRGNLEGVISATDIIRAYHEVKIHAIMQKQDPHFT